MTNDTSLIDLDVLLAPLSEEDAGGEDMSFSLEFDQIREARRADDASLSQGAWETAIKSAEWSKVIELTTRILQQKSKDLQATLWLTEALTQTNGFRGMVEGLRLTTRLLEEHWDCLYPRMEDGSVDERVGKLAWLANRLPEVVRLLPLTRQDRGAYSLAHWREALALENLAAKDREAFQKAIGEGRTTREAIEKQVRLSGTDFYRTALADSMEALNALSDLEQVINSRFEGDAPSLSSLRDEISNATELLQRFGKDLGVTLSEPITISEAEHRAPPPDTHTTVGSGPVRTRAEALARLAEVAAFFRRTEPHSPVAYLADKAAHWGTLSLDQWLRTVIKDDNVLSHLEETLGVAAHVSDASNGEA
jgi:type VI secretion system protein ImpA